MTDMDELLALVDAQFALRDGDLEPWPDPHPDRRPLEKTSTRR